MVVHQVCLKEQENNTAPISEKAARKGAIPQVRAVRVTSALSGSALHDADLLLEVDAESTTNQHLAGEHALTRSRSSQPPPSADARSVELRHPVETPPPVIAVFGTLRISFKSIMCAICTTLREALDFAQPPPHHHAPQICKSA